MNSHSALLPWAEAPGHTWSLLPHYCKGNTGLLWGRMMKPTLSLLSLVFPTFLMLPGTRAEWRKPLLQIPPSLPHVATTRLLGAVTFTLLCASESPAQITMGHGDHCILLSKMLCSRWSPYSLQPGLGQGWSKVILGPKEREINASFALFLKQPHSHGSQLPHGLENQAECYRFKETERIQRLKTIQS